jgi:hypothetical protein
MQAVDFVVVRRGEPGFELGCGAEVEDAAEVEGVVEGGALVVEHDVVGAGDAHDGVGSRCPNIVRRQSVSS